MNNLDTTKASSDEIEVEIKRLQKALKEKNTWPKKYDLYLHHDKESGYNIAQELNLPREAQSVFAYVAYEICLTLEVHEDGTAYALELDGVKLAEKVKI